MPFDGMQYIAANPDLIRAGVTTAAAGEAHYQSYGQREGRATTFNAAAYIASYTDLSTVFGTNTIAALQHYISSGWREGRSITFDATSYLAANRDLMAAGITTAEGAAAHYIANGRAEGRGTAFNALGYLNANPDLFPAGVDTAAEAAQHYVSWGYNEGRRIGSYSSYYLTNDTSVARPGYAYSNTIIQAQFETPYDIDEYDIYMSVGQTYTFRLTGSESGLGTVDSHRFQVSRPSSPYTAVALYLDNTHLVSNTTQQAETSSYAEPLLTYSPNYYSGWYTISVTNSAPTGSGVTPSTGTYALSVYSQSRSAGGALAAV